MPPDPRGLGCRLNLGPTCPGAQLARRPSLDPDLTRQGHLGRPDYRPSDRSRGFTKIAPTLHPFAGTRKVTFTVAPGGTTFGVADPTSRPRIPLPSSSATNSVAGSELLLRTVTFQDRAPGGMGPASGGTGVGLGVGLGGGRGRASGGLVPRMAATRRQGRTAPLSPLCTGRGPSRQSCHLPRGRCRRAAA